MDSNTISLLTIVFGSSTIGAVVGYFIKYFFDLDLNKKQEKYSNKRKLYEELIQSLNIFLTNRNNSQEKQDIFLANYSASWLWASESVILRIGDFINHISTSEKHIEDNQAKAKVIFSDIVILMRKDLGFSKIQIKNKDYKFFSFNNLQT